MALPSSIRRQNDNFAAKLGNVAHWSDRFGQYANVSEYVWIHVLLIVTVSPVPFHNAMKWRQRFLDNLLHNRWMKPVVAAFCTNTRDCRHFSQSPLAKPLACSPYLYLPRGVSMYTHQWVCARARGIPVIHVFFFYNSKNFNVGFSHCKSGEILGNNVVIVTGCNLLKLQNILNL